MTEYMLMQLPFEHLRFRSFHSVPFECTVTVLIQWMNTNDKSTFPPARRKQENELPVQQTSIIIILTGSGV